MSDILNCGQGKQKSELVRFTYQCPKYWQKLQVTKNDSVRFCDACQENVYYCTDKQEAEQHARQGHCIAIASKLTAAVDRQYEKPQQDLVMGMLKPSTILPEHSKAWAKDIFDYQKHQLVKAIRDRTITVTKIDYRDLSHADLSGVDLSYADLSGVNLFNTNLSGANLSHANLSGANLIKTNLSHANLSGVDLSPILQDSSTSQKANLDWNAIDDMWENSFADKNINLDGAILEPKDKIQYLIHQGKRYQTKNERAIEYLQQALSMARELKARATTQKYCFVEAEILGILANRYLAQDESKAEELYQQALSLDRAIGNRSRAAQTLTKLGNIYLKRQAKIEALNYFQQAQIILEQLNDRHQKISNLRSIISICEDLGSKENLLIEYYQKMLSFVPQDTTTIDKLADIYEELGNEPKAFEYLQLAISLREKSIRSQELTYLGTEIYLLKAIAEIYESSSDVSNALKYYQQLLTLKRRISIRPPEAESFNQLIQYYYKQVKTQGSSKLLQDLLQLPKNAIALSKERKNSLDLCIGKLYLDLGERQKSLEYYERGIVAVKELRIQFKRNRPYYLENLDSDRKHLLEIIDRLNNRSERTLNLSISPYCQKLLQERENHRLEVEQLIEKITTILIIKNCS